MKKSHLTRSDFIGSATLAIGGIAASAKFKAAGERQRLSGSAAQNSLMKQDQN